MSRVPSRWAGLAPFLVTALAAYGAFRLGIRPAMEAEAGRVEEEVVQLKTRADAAGEGPSGSDAGEAAELARELARTGERVTALTGILATSSEAEAVLQSLGSMASAAGVRFLRFAPEPEYRLDGYVARAASVVAEGTFFEVLSFFERVSLSPHLVLVEELGIELAGGGLIHCRFVAVTVRAAAAGLASGHEAVPVSTGTGSDEADAGESEC